MCSALPTRCLVTFLVLLGTAGSLAASVTLYRDAGFRGESETFRANVADLRRSRLGSDTASSVRVRTGCVVTLYADANFRGAFTELDRDEPTLESAAVGNDRASSLRITCRGGGWIGPDTRSGVMLYRDEGYQGAEEWLPDDIPALGRTEVGDNAASSLRASAGCRVRLYENVDYGGRYAELGGEVWRLSETRIGNDRASSLQLRCPGDRRPWGPTRPGGPGWPGGGGGRPPGYGVTLYRDAGFRGELQTFDGSVGDLRGSTVGNDEASSVRVPRGCRVVLFSESGFRGAAIELRDDLSDLGRTGVGNDQVSSLRVDCR